MDGLEAPKEGKSRKHKSKSFDSGGFGGGDAAFGAFPAGSGFGDSGFGSSTSGFGTSDFGTAPADGWGSSGFGGGGGTAAGWPAADGFPPADSAASSGFPPIDSSSSFPSAAPPEAAAPQPKRPAMPTIGSLPQPAATKAPEPAAQAAASAGSWAIDEQRLAMYEGAYKKAANQDGFVEPAAARMVLERTGLPNDDLSKIWRLSDVDGDGLLSFGEFLCAVHVAFRRSKEGVEIPPSVPEELAAFGKTSQQAAAAPPAPAAAPEPVQAVQPVAQAPPEVPAAAPVPPAQPPSATSSAPQSIYLVAAEELDRYRGIFEGLSAGTGFVDATAGKDLFEQSGLPLAELGHIWSSADLDHDGKLGPDEFVRAMVMVDRRRNGADLPQELPAELVTLQIRHSDPASSASPPPTGEPQPAEEGWDISVTELERYAPLIADVDPDRTGFVTAENGKDFFESSGLPVQELGQIWQMADLDQDSILAPQEFIIAMALVAKRRAGLPLPASVPPELRAAAAQVGAAMVAAQQAAAAGAPSPQPAASPPPAAASPPPAAAAAPVAAAAPTPEAAPQLSGEPPSLGPDWVVTKEELMRYRRIFVEKAAKNEEGELYMNGASAKAVMDQSGLGVQDLCTIWALSDRNSDGILVLPEFLIALSIVGRRLKGVPMPDALPKELIESVDIAICVMEGRPVPTEEAAPAAVPVAEPVAPAPAPAPVVEAPPVSSGAAPAIEAREEARPVAAAPVMQQQPEEPPAPVAPAVPAAPPAPTVVAAPAPVPAATPAPAPVPVAEKPPQKSLWTPKEEELTKYRAIFRRLDTANLGSVNSDAARQVLQSSSLPTAQAAQIWELIGVTSSGLSAGAFCCAIVLASRCRQGAVLPSSLPEELRSLRNE